MIARSSQVRSTERRHGVSMAEVVMEDMAIGNSVSLWPQLAPCGPLPGIHIAQFHYQVIGNCGLSDLMQCNKGMLRFARRSPLGHCSNCWVGQVHIMTVSWRPGAF
jgi:hypothetical protein